MVDAVASAVHSGPQARLTVSGMVKTFGATKALIGVDLTVAPGEA